MRDFFRSLVLSGLLFYSTGCSTDITGGKLLSKVYEPTRTYYREIISSTFDSNNQKVFRRFRQTLRDDQDFILVIGKSLGSEYRTRAVYVPKETFNSVEEGSEINLENIDYSNSDPSIDVMDEERIE